MDVGRWTLDVGRWTLDVGRWTLDVGRWTLRRWTSREISGLSPRHLHLAMRHSRLFGFVVAGVASTAPVTARAQGAASAAAPYDVPAHYKKYEYKIPMRDGVKLFTSVFVPRETTSSYPILMVRTPYGVGPLRGERLSPHALAPSDEFLRAGYIFVRQDVRGRFKSGGTFVQMTPHLDVKAGPRDIDESTDTYDTIDWLIHNVKPNNGRVGLWGISYSGFFAAAGAIDAHPALKAVSPQAPQADWFMGDDVHHNGAFFLTSAFNWMAMCGRSGAGQSMSCGVPFDFGSPDGFSFYLGLGSLKNADARYFHGQIPGWTEIMDHGNFDSLWQARNLRPHLRNVRPAIMSVGGWYDANNLFGALQVYQSIIRQSPSTDARLVIGPWYHGQWTVAGDSINSLHFGANTSAFYRTSIIFPFFEHYLRRTLRPICRALNVFETGGEHVASVRVLAAAGRRDRSRSTSTRTGCCRSIRQPIPAPSHSTNTSVIPPPGPVRAVAQHRHGS